MTHSGQIQHNQISLAFPGQHHHSWHHTTHFIPVDTLPAGTMTTYICMMCAYCPKNKYPHCMQWTVVRIV